MGSNPLALVAVLTAVLKGSPEVLHAPAFITGNSTAYPDLRELAFKQDAPVTRAIEPSGRDYGGAAAGRPYVKDFAKPGRRVARGPARVAKVEPSGPV